MRLLLSLPLAGLALSLTGAACSSAGAEVTDPDPLGTATAAITGSTVLSNGEEWVAAKLHYCQAAYGAVDDDSSCWAWEGSSHRCERESNAAWNAYRSDCSGFITFSWGLPAIGDGGYTTGDFAPFATSISSVIQAADLSPGDACNLTAGGHIVLFKAWTTVGSEAVFLEEPGCSASPPYAHEFTSAVTLSGSSIYIDYEGESFTAIRFNQLTGATTAPSCEVAGTSGSCLASSTCSAMSGYTATSRACTDASLVCCTPAPPPACTVDGVKGTCIDKTTCASMVDYVSTAGQCSGAANIECCTLAAPPSCTVGGVKGTCIKTTACAGMAGYVSTPGYCPGPNEEECCTPTGVGTGESSSSSGDAGAGGSSSGGSIAGAGGESSSSTGAPTKTSAAKSSGCATSPLAPVPAGSRNLAALALCVALAARRRRPS